MQININQDSPNKKRVNVRSSQVFYNIADEDMNEFFMDYVEEPQQKNNVHPNQKTELKQEQNKQNIIDENQQDKQQPENQVVSRLQIEIDKYQLNFVPVYGQIFIMLVQGQLLSEQKKQNGKLLVTNYRLAFFKYKMKKLDLPFGFISQCKLNDKNQQIIANLKYNHFWKLKISELKHFNNVKIFLQIYLKIQSIRSCFAFNYAAKFPQISLFTHHSTADQMQRLGFKSNVKQIRMIDNSKFTICQSYPQILYVPIKITDKIIEKIARSWAQQRFPVLTYIHKFSNHNQLNLTGIWRCSYLMYDKSQNINEVSKYLQFIKAKNQKIIIFDSGFKYGKKGVDQSQVYNKCQVRFLQTQTRQNIKNSYIAIVQSFLVPKKTFFKDIISSKWYEITLQFLKGANQMAYKLLGRQSIIVKCSNGRQKSAILSALAQIIINPYYRTFRGFQALIQKQFIYYGFPFLDKLGLTNKKEQQCPIFIIFLDCVSQLFKNNEMCFQFNYKYLSKLSNLMYTNLFGTFITNCRKQRVQNKVQAETIPIWNQLISDLTRNAFYFQKSGVLQIPTSFDDIRIWKQHFSYLTTPPRQTYKLHPLAQDNLDYANLNCHRVVQENKFIQDQIQKQKRIIFQLKKKIAQKQEQKSACQQQKQK